MPAWYLNSLTGKYYPTFAEANSAHLQPASGGSPGNPQYGPNSPMALKAKLEKSRQENIYDPIKSYTNMFNTRPFQQLTTQMQARASGMDTPFDQQYMDARLGESSDAINRQLQMGNQNIQETTARSGVGGGIRASAQNDLRRMAGQSVRAERIKNIADVKRDKHTFKRAGQLDLASWLKQSYDAKRAGTLDQAQYRAQEHFYQNSPDSMMGTSGPVPTGGQARGSVRQTHRGWETKPSPPKPEPQQPQNLLPQQQTWSPQPFGAGGIGYGTPVGPSSVQPYGAGRRSPHPTVPQGQVYPNQKFTDGAQHLPVSPDEGNPVNPEFWF